MQLYNHSVAESNPALLLQGGQPHVDFLAIPILPQQIPQGYPQSVGDDHGSHQFLHNQYW